MDDAELRTLFADLPPQVRDVVRRAARTDQSERDELTHRLERNPDGVETGKFGGSSMDAEDWNRMRVSGQSRSPVPTVYLVG
jgi:hypothetical protein